jgi:hypothetical protein
MTKVKGNFPHCPISVLYIAICQSCGVGEQSFDDDQIKAVQPTIPERHITSKVLEKKQHSFSIIPQFDNIIMRVTKTVLMFAVLTVCMVMTAASPVSVCP